MDDFSIACESQRNRIRTSEQPRVCFPNLVVVAFPIKTARAATEFRRPYQERTSVPSKTKFLNADGTVERPNLAHNVSWQQIADSRDEQDGSQFFILITIPDEFWFSRAQHAHSTRRVKTDMQHRLRTTTADSADDIHRS